MGKLTIIVECNDTDTSTLERDAHSWFDELRQAGTIPDAVEVFIVPSDD